RRVYAPQRETARGFHREVVGLLEIALVRRVVGVALVRQVRRPVTCRCEHLGDEEPLRGAILHEDLVDRARRRTRSPFLDRRVLVQRGVDALRRRRPADGDLAAFLPALTRTDVPGPTCSAWG